MTSPVCDKCDCVKGCQSNPSPCPILLAECIASDQVSAAQIEAHRVLDAAICTPAQARELAIFVGYDPELTDALCSLADQIEALTEKTIAQPEQTAINYTYASTQETNCAGCGILKHTPLRVDKMEGYVCLTCIDKKLESLLDAAIAQPEQTAPVRQPLTEGDIIEISRQTATAEPGLDGYILPVSFARAIEAAHGITSPKETT